ncbi:MAG TPA: 16S rRNA (guanine(966)-N(2))-methyltransferase RsmD [Flexilinea sp.]|jgi:16S rRNA (guanine(966)-N(2))-methyltransferase RsmD|nr:16S rRNA (guanine(966)-N(2))-methyltransferase RsmD [Flexilinea sp.]HOG60429.1 16S rRNA (guanine(966)-N(2))-methyltransferase RsmD [Flexilinea sp.]HOP01256.1 16S rRNA (guanine(966)-N(2))-methyltransferase RsmD [Flexilinea sp.]HOR56641.1 16S rRNA (guanine(966)-N(2))-methyltransferase RsmD [Flexilinea sp.]HOU19241.1 16S rRNA (guanine(966)-N(2))-methyltransferase RsmD [Flexilinea sp.]
MATPRIIAGTAKGMRLHSVPGDSTRPVTDRVKEALFNILGTDIADAGMFDLFGGTGSVGLEALSRGASYVRFMDANRNAYKTLQENIKLTGFEKKSKAIFGDVFGYLRTVPDREFEYIYVAPPQYKRLWQKTMQILDDNDGWLSEDGWIIVQIHPVELEPLELNNFIRFDERKYGSTALLFYRRKPSPSNAA